MSIAEKLENEYREAIEKFKQYENHFKEVVVSAIEKCGLDGDVIEKQSGRKGRLVVEKNRYNNRRSPYNVEFHLLKKDGTLAVNRSGFFYLGDNADEFEKQLMQAYEKA